MPSEHALNVAGRVHTMSENSDLDAPQPTPHDPLNLQSGRNLRYFDVFQPLSRDEPSNQGLDRDRRSDIHSGGITETFAALTGSRVPGIR